MAAAFGAAGDSSDLKLVIKRARLPMKKYDNEEIPESEFQPYMKNLFTKMPFDSMLLGCNVELLSADCLVVTN